MGNLKSSSKSKKLNTIVDLKYTSTDGAIYTMPNLFTGNNLDGLGDLNNDSNVDDLSMFLTGTYEVQECLEGQGEIDLHTHKANCEKNPGHAEFVPVNKFSNGHFPAGYDDNDLYDLTKALSDLTVRISAKFTSPDRPQFVPGTEYPYPCNKTRGKESLRTATGRVWRIAKHSVEIDDYNTCPCPECEHAVEPSKVWWMIYVRTARHVIFDDIELRQSCCRLWFDDENSPVVNIYGWKVCLSDTEEDRCWFSCVTHVLEIAEQLNEMVDRFDGLYEKVSYKYKSRSHLEKLTIIVSHPHGCSKQVSIGYCVQRQMVGNRWIKYTYTTCTCPGSSGALVYRLGCWRPDHPHSGAESNGLNYSVLWMD